MPHRQIRLNLGGLKCPLSCWGLLLVEYWVAGGVVITRLGLLDTRSPLSIMCANGEVVSCLKG